MYAHTYSRHTRTHACIHMHSCTHAHAHTHTHNTQNTHNTIRTHTHNTHTQHAHTHTQHAHKTHTKHTQNTQHTHTKHTQNRHTQNTQHTQTQTRTTIYILHPTKVIPFSVVTIANCSSEPNYGPVITYQDKGHAWQGNLKENRRMGRWSWVWKVYPTCQHLMAIKHIDRFSIKQPKKSCVSLNKHIFLHIYIYMYSSLSWRLNLLPFPAHRLSMTTSLTNSRNIMHE